MDYPFPMEAEQSTPEQIDFYSEDVEFELNDPIPTISWITHLIQAEGKNLQQLSFIFCSDAYLHDLNMQYLDHDTLTDIITFHYAKLPDVEGDIFISIERLQENAQLYKTTFEDELYRVIAHGVLHLCGYSDKSTEEKAQMTEKENQALEKWRTMQLQKS